MHGQCFEFHWNILRHTGLVRKYPICQWLFPAACFSAKIVSNYDMDLSKLKFHRANGESLYDQLVNALESAIEEGGLAPGARLPSERDLAISLKLSRSTTTHAYRELESRCVLRRHVGRGTFVCATPEPDEIPFAWRGKVSATALRSANPALRNLMRDGVDPAVISLALGGPALECFPTAEFRRIYEQILKREPAAALGHGPTEG